MKPVEWSDVDAVVDSGIQMIATAWARSGQVVIIDSIAQQARAVAHDSLLALGTAGSENGLSVRDGQRVRLLTDVDLYEYVVTRARTVRDELLQPRPDESRLARAAELRESIRRRAEIRAKEIEQRAEMEKSVRVAEKQAVEASIRSRTYPPPEPQLYGVSDVGAEFLVAEWLRHLGAVDAQVTRYGSDGGVDVEMSTHVVQVKNYSGSVSVVELRELLGAATVEGKIPILFTSGRLTASAREFAERAEIAVVRYDALEAQIAGLNDRGQILVHYGFTRQQES